MQDFTTKEIIDAGYELLEQAKRARRADRKASLRRQAYVCFNEVNHTPSFS